MSVAFPVLEFPPARLASATIATPDPVTPFYRRRSA